MTFPSILPHLASGRKVRRASWTTSVWLRDGIDADIHDLLSSDWELLEEPVSCARCANWREELATQDATITRLTRDLSISGAACKAQASENQRLTRELAEARKEQQLEADALMAAKELVSKAIQHLEDV